MGVNTVFGLLTGLVDTVMLGLLGVPLAGALGPAGVHHQLHPLRRLLDRARATGAVALLTGGWQLAGIVLALYTVVNFVLTSVIQPKYVGDAVGISVSLTLVALVFWGWVLGVIGAVLAVPADPVCEVAARRHRPEGALDGCDPRLDHHGAAQCGGGRPAR